MTDSPDMTTVHRISVPTDVDALIFTVPYRSDVELTESIPTVNVCILGHTYPSTRRYSSYAAPHATMTAARSTLLRRSPAHWPPHFR
ncbi:hypothetical protein [Corynebacterium pseudodiphtheriticum]|uniref:hypothetical protein n=1 Tax=Corynebacterium pseudodiphtheriticum TaxID=37637 RepID=UPI001EE881A0|nr:hypothetical protein [Corynebacterium pseudodiphtheriticum]MDK8709585.1 hypothetical protein [Corynebacterium pseudodiphtheriticum]